MSNNAFNKFFDKIFVISLYDTSKKYEKVEKQFKNRKIDVERFIAVDGRCKKQGDKVCRDKIKTFENIYNIKISNKCKMPLNVLVPASSLTIGTILILREMVKQKWKHILICEDDVELSYGLERKFKEGLKEIGNYKWDLLYLGCGSRCGLNGISEDKSKKNKYYSELAKVYEDEYYVNYKDDLRVPCEDDSDCKHFSEHITRSYYPGGTWAYAYSLKGAKKLLKLIDNDAGNHIDQIIKDNTWDGKLSALAFDPPIIWHEGGALRTESSIPWNW